jgi:hypothetical protein
MGREGFQLTPLTCREIVQRCPQRASEPFEQAGYFFP